VTEDDRTGPGDPARGIRLPPPPDLLFTTPVRPQPAAPTRRSVAVVALLSGLLGALVGSGLVALVLRPATPTAARSAPVAREILAPSLPAPADAPPERVAAIAAAVLPTVVQVDIDGVEQAHALTGNGSGVIYRSDGFIITNNHVVAQANEIRVTFDNGDVKSAEIVGTDPINDLAVIKVDAVDLPAIQIGDMSSVQIGELAVAVGSPFGLPGSVTAGIISGLDRPLDITSPGGDPIRLVDVIQTDAPINPGNSGGALVGGDGRLIGINSAILTNGAPSNAGVGFAIAADTVVRVADQLISSGVVRYSFLGIQGETISPADANRLQVDHGARVDRVEPGTPAEAAGLRTDDVIVEAAGAPIRTMDDLIGQLRQQDVGSRVSITFIRDGGPRSVDVVLAERPNG
jgi:putative serine protease PepD